MQRRGSILDRVLVRNNLHASHTFGVFQMLCSVLLIALTSCSTVNKYGIDVDESTSAASSNLTAGGVDAILSPARDLNLRRTPIPDGLKKIEQVYLDIPLKKCKVIAREILELNEILGKDDDEPDTSIDPTLSTQVGEQTAKRTLDLIASTTTSLLPARGVFRQVTGAARHEKEVRAAYQRGAQRRSYLKGVGQANGCKYPAAPMSGQKAPKTKVVLKR